MQMISLPRLKLPKSLLPMTMLPDFDELSETEKEHFYRCSKCGQLVDKRELRDVIFHLTDHKRKPHIPRIKGKPIRNVFRS